MSLPFYRLKCCCPVNGVSNTLITTTNNTFNQSFANSISNIVVGLDSNVFNKNWTEKDLNVLVDSKADTFNKSFVDSIVNLYFKAYVFGYKLLKAITSPLILMGFCKDKCCGINSKVNVFVKSFMTLTEYPIPKIGKYISQIKCGECDERIENILQFKSSAKFITSAEVKQKVYFNPVNIKTGITSSIFNRVKTFGNTKILKPIIDSYIAIKQYVKANSNTYIKTYSTIADDGITIKLRESLEYSYSPVISIDMEGKKTLTLDLSNSLTDDITDVESETEHSYLKRSITIIPDKNNISLVVKTINQEYFLNLMVNNYDK